MLSSRRITEDMILKSKININKFLILSQSIMGKESITPNFHELSHITEIIRMSGPLWLHSTVNFESLNFSIKKFVIILLLKNY